MAFSLVPGWIKHRGWGSFNIIASAARSLCSQWLINIKHVINKKIKKKKAPEIWVLHATI